MNPEDLMLATCRVTRRADTAPCAAARAPTSLLPVLLLLALLAAQAAEAQTHAVDRGVWQFGGSASVVGFSGAGSSGVAVGLSPFVGYFVAPGLALTGTAWGSYRVDDYGHYSSYGVGPGLTYYFVHTATPLHPMVGARFRWGQTVYDPDQSSSITSTTYGVSASAGLVYLLARNVGLTGELFYEWSHYKDDLDLGGQRTSDRSNYGVQFGFEVFLY